MEYTILQIWTQELCSKLTTKLPTNSKVDTHFLSSLHETQPLPIHGESPRNNFSPPNENEIAFEDNNASVATLCTQISLSTSQVLHDLGLASSSEDMNIEDQDDDGDNQAQGVDTSIGFDDGNVNWNLNNPSYDENIADPFALLELRDNFEKANFKFDIVSSKVTVLYSKFDLVIKSLDSMFDLVIKSLRLIRTLEDVDQRYKDNLDHHISTINMMFKIDDDIISTTNELIQQTHVLQEKQI